MKVYIIFLNYDNTYILNYIKICDYDITFSELITYGLNILFFKYFNHYFWELKKKLF